MPATTMASAASPQWEDLPPELLANISGRLHAASDSVRFHAVCWAWRVAGDQPSYALPWLVAPSSAVDASAEDQRCRCIFSKATYRAPGICVRDRRVACANGTAAWLVNGKEKIFLVNPLTADKLTFPDQCMSDKWLHHSHRNIARNGTVLLYDFDPNPPDEYYSRDLGRMIHFPPPRFQASFLSPDHGKWQRVWSNLGSSDRCCAVAYHHGGYVVCVDLANCHVLWPGWEPICQGQLRLESTWKVQAALPEEPGKVRRGSYLVDYGGGLLLASVLQEAAGGGGLSVSLHELCLLDADNKIFGEEPEVEWVRQDRSAFDIAKLSDRVMFLGFPGSFAIKAAKFGGEISGGAAYFVIEDAAPAACVVYRYAFHDGVAVLVERLPPGWSDARCMWLLPDPQILAAFDPPEEDSVVPVGSYVDIQSCGNNDGPPPPPQQLRIYAGGLSPNVDNSRLREMFSVYGKVARARVVYNKKGRSRGFGFVTMATQEGFHKAMASLNAVEVDDEPHPHGGFTSPFSLLVMLLILWTIFMFFYRL
ncbi:unnamed protein product [Urochloa decumbens]|uniref:RRM domain-containing protein n=1 Tax=Urochloa decumbens TaxID=240449 RepID=A0ABC8W6Q6_9POAL